ncbi:MAG: putative bifunctional diguanylate cyclase/phosphodiesterase [Thiomonas sp.]
MKPPRLSTQMFGSRLARQLFALFVVAALVPLAMSDWLSSTAVNAVARQLYMQSQQRMTRQVSRQVFDRLLTAKALLRSLPLAAPQPDALPPGMGRVFLALLQLSAQGKPEWASPNAATLWADWLSATPHIPPVQPTESKSAGQQQVLLRTRSMAGQPARVYLAALQSGQVRWVAELNPEFLWSPVHDAMDGGVWRVRNAQGLQLYPAEVAGQDTGAAGADHASPFEFQLFLGGEFGTPDWVFTQQAPPPQVNWLGWPLAVWLGLVAVATLLLIGLLAQRQIRRTLVPLERLTEGTRRLAAGDISTRVEVHSKDEFGNLADAFNDMAARLGAQFHALEGLAAIDRDILSSASVDSLAQRVLDQLKALYPEAEAVIVWQQSSRVFRRAVLWQSGKQNKTVFDVRDVACDATAHAQWSQLQQDETVPAAALARGHAHDAPCLRSLMPPAADWVALLPLRQGEVVRALLAIGLPAQPAPGALHAAAELRDRLAVAFAAQDRQQALMHQATHDSLTGLLNRHGLHQRLGDLLAPDRQTPNLALLYIDLDHFKEVNDSRGHATGDALLCQASDRLRERVQADALVARQGGDEFTLVLPQADAATAQAVAETVIRAMSEPFHLPGGDFQVGASVGIALCPQHGRVPDELLRCADIALYAAKAYGRGRAQLFNPTLDTEARALAALLADLRQALARGEFVAFYQPRVRASDGVVSSAEALIRWQHPQRGLLSPDAFIPLAESSGLIGPMGQWMLEAACQQMADWRRMGIIVPRVSVNVSALQLAPGQLVGQVRAALARSGIAPAALELEITESLLVDDNQSAFAQLAALRDMGVTIALDDFGTGYSSMAALRKLPIDVMKIDRSFVADLETDASALPSVRAIVALAQAAQLHLVAEGVETEAQARMLRELGCQELQGYLYSRPVAPTQFLQVPGLRHQPPAG